MNVNRYKRRQRAVPGSFLATMRMAAHQAFDPIWQSGHMKRRHAYRWLADELGISRLHWQEYCHIGMFDILTCERVIKLCAPLRDEILAAEVTDNKYGDLC